MDFFFQIFLSKLKELKFRLPFYEKNTPVTNPGPDPMIPTVPVSNQKDSISTGWHNIQLSDSVLADIQFSC